MSALKSIPGQEVFQLQHLRRFAKSPFLPTWLQEQEDNSIQSWRRDKRSDGDRQRPSSSDSQSDSSQRSSSFKRAPREAYMLLCPTKSITEEELVTHLKARVSSLFENQNESTCRVRDNQKFKLLKYRVPLFSPSTLEVASELSRTVWPIIFNPNTTYGPNPTDLAKVQSKLQSSAAKYMGVAGDVARECQREGFGVRSGAVIVERCIVEGEEVERIVCVAGDGRYWNPQSAEPLSEDASSPHTCDRVGNPAGHAVMRAISIVAAKRRILASPPPTTGEKPATKASSPVVPAVDLVFLEKPLLPLEQQHNPREDNLKPNGYLCVDLEIYITHEPCVMCCMALNHSRFGRVIFEREMPQTGGLCAERSTAAKYNDYGLFWRDELTWRILTWQWERGGSTNEQQLGMSGQEESDDMNQRISV